jgi:hypothetical protein
MKMTRIALATAALLAVTGLAYVAQQNRTAGTDMVAAADQFLGSLTTEQKTQTSFPFESMERFDWNFIPLQDKERRPTRKGLSLQEMTPAQRQAALALLKAGTSEKGNVAAVTIMSLEEILRDLEKKGAMVRNPEWYFYTVFGMPSKTARWGWRVEGHHLSLNFTMEGTQVVSATPSFFGANPAEIKSGPRKGERILAPSEDPARELYKALDEAQKKVAYHQEMFPEPVQKSVAFKREAPVGLPAARMTEAQKQLLWTLLESYTGRMPAEVGEVELKRVRDAGPEKVHFAYNGSTELGQKHTYRVQGPTFVIEFRNEQADSAGNPANHIHSVWRHLTADFGVDSAKKAP